jgi:hypothetical protein
MVKHLVTPITTLTEHTCRKKTGFRILFPSSCLQCHIAFLSSCPLGSLALLATPAPVPLPLCSCLLSSTLLPAPSHRYPSTLCFLAFSFQSRSIIVLLLCLCSPLYSCILVLARNARRSSSSSITPCPYPCACPAPCSQWLPPSFAAPCPTFGSVSLLQTQPSPVRCIEHCHPHYTLDTRQ